MSTPSGNLSRVYVSKAIETTQGAGATLTMSFLVKSAQVVRQDDEAPDDNVTGLLNATTMTRMRTFAGGPLVGYLQPELAAWAYKMVFGAAPTSALVSPSTTVYEHTFNAFTTPCGTFSFMQQDAKITNYTDQLNGCAIKALKIASSKGKVTLTADIIGMGKQTLSNAEPVVTATSETFHVGTNTDIKIDGTSAYANAEYPKNDWTVDIMPGIDLQEVAGTTDGTVPRIDLVALRKVTATYTLQVKDLTRFNDYVNATLRTYEFISNGPVIDSPNSLNALVTVKLMKARATKKHENYVGKHGVWEVKYTVEGIMDTSLSQDVTCRVRNLVSSYA